MPVQIVLIHECYYSGDLFTFFTLLIATFLTVKITNMSAGMNINSTIVLVSTIGENLVLHVRV